MSRVGIFLVLWSCRLPPSALFSLLLLHLCHLEEVSNHTEIFRSEFQSYPLLLALAICSDQRLVKRSADELWDWMIILKVVWTQWLIATISSQTPQTPIGSFLTRIKVFAVWFAVKRMLGQLSEGGNGREGRQSHTCCTLRLPSPKPSCSHPREPLWVIFAEDVQSNRVDGVLPRG